MNSLEERFLSVRVHVDAESPALHKPLLLLFALGRALQGAPRMLPFAEIDIELKTLFDLFHKKASASANTHYPFGKLENDGIWVVENSDSLQRTSVGHLFKSEILARNIHGGFTPEIFAELTANPNIIRSIAASLVTKFIPPEDHAPLLAAVGIESSSSIERAQFIDAGNAVDREYATSYIRESNAGEDADMQENGFIAYLGSLFNVESSGSNSLAESQALNPYYGAVYRPFPLVDDLFAALTDGTERVVILTGHAGDGKSSVALDVLKRLRRLDPTAPLAAPWLEREDCPSAAGPVVIVKDMSELAGELRLHYLHQACSEPGSWLVVSNTGPLLNSLNDYAETLGLSDIESDLLGLMDRTYQAGLWDAHRYSELPKEIVIINMTRLDNVALGAQILTRLVDHPAWSDCTGCPIELACPLLLNRKAIQSAGAIAEQRVRWIWQRLTAYEQRLTMRQMVAQLAFGLTGGVGCADAHEAVQSSTVAGMDHGLQLLAQMVFSEGFFGYRGGAPHPDATALRAIALTRRGTYGGPIAVDFERRLTGGEGLDWSSLPTPLHGLAAHWRERAKEPSGVRRRFALRRLAYVFADAQPQRGGESEIFLDAFLQSPSLRDYDAWQRAGTLKLSRSELHRLRTACLQVLLEFYSGFSAGQFGALREQLYLTLRRPDQAVVQPTQLVIARLDFRDFQVVYCARRRLPVLRFDGGQIPVELPLSLPLLDYISGREAGEIGNELSPIHSGQLEWFRAELLRVTAEDRRDLGEIELLRAGIDGEIIPHRCQFDETHGTLEYLQ